MANLCRSRNSDHGRTVGYPAGPVQIPACGFSAPGSSGVLASARLSCHYGPRTRLPITLGAFDNMWFLNPKLFKQLVELNPIVTRSLTASVQVLHQQQRDPVKELL